MKHNYNEDDVNCRNTNLKGRYDCNSGNCNLSTSAHLPVTQPKSYSRIGGAFGEFSLV